MSDLVTDLFEFWKQCSRHPRARLDDKRRKDITKALRWGYPEADLRLAILGCCTDPWYAHGQNVRNGIYTHIGLIFRDADHIDKFITLGEQEVGRAWNLAKAEEQRRADELTRSRSIPAEIRSKIAGFIGRHRTK